jgi:hypothetical protein
VRPADQRDAGQLRVGGLGDDENPGSHFRFKA